jgi:hypothetical protein
MIFQKRPPSLGWRLGDPTMHQVGNCSLGNLDSQLEQLAMNPGRTPQWIGLRHSENKITDLRVDRRSAGPFGTRFKPPEQFEAFFVPSHHGVWIDDD